VTQIAPARDLAPASCNLGGAVPRRAQPGTGSRACGELAFNLQVHRKKSILSYYLLLQEIILSCRACHFEAMTS